MLQWLPPPLDISRLKASLLFYACAPPAALTVPPTAAVGGPSSTSMSAMATLGALLRGVGDRLASLSPQVRGQAAEECLTGDLLFLLHPPTSADATAAGAARGAKAKIVGAAELDGADGADDEGEGEDEARDREGGREGGGGEGGVGVAVGDEGSKDVTWPHLLAPLLSNGSDAGEASTAAGAGAAVTELEAEAQSRALTLRLTALLSVRSSGRHYLSLAFGQEGGYHDADQSLVGLGRCNFM